MSSAYIHAERKIINDATQGIDTTGHMREQFGPMNAEQFFEFEVDSLGNMKSVTEKDILLDKAREVRNQLEEAIDNDEFEKAELLQRTLNAIQSKYNKL